MQVNYVFEDISRLDCNKSSGTDNIGPKILKLSAPFIVTSLTYIFNRMIDTGIFPTILKNAKVSPVYKAGDRFLATNYRPISVLPTISKLIEKHISNHMHKFMSRFNLLQKSSTIWLQTKSLLSNSFNKYY